MTTKDHHFCWSWWAFWILFCTNAHDTIKQEATFATHRPILYQNPEKKRMNQVNFSSVCISEDGFHATKHWCSLSISDNERKEIFSFKTCTLDDLDNFYYIQEGLSFPAIITVNHDVIVFLSFFPHEVPIFLLLKNHQHPRNSINYHILICLLHEKTPP